MGTGWNVLRIRSRCEHRAAKALERHGLEYYFPRVRIPRPPAGEETRPLFPGYLFVRHDRDREDWPSVRTLSGVLGWLSFEGVIPQVPDAVIEELERRVDEINGTGGLWERFQPGDTVLVASHKLEGLAEVLERPKSPEARVRVLLHFMGGQVRAEVPWHHLRPATRDEVTPLRRRLRRTRGRGRWVQGFGPRDSTARAVGAVP